MQEIEVRSARRRDPRRKLLGWGILAVVTLAVVGLFFLARLGSPVADKTSATAPAASASMAGPSEVASAQSPVATLPAPASTSAAGPAPFDLSTMDQPARQTFVVRLITQGVLTAVKLPPGPKVGVTDIFLGLTPELKTQFMALVDAYVHDGKASDEPLQVVDATTRRAIGTYAPGTGLILRQQ